MCCPCVLPCYLVLYAAFLKAQMRIVAFYTTSPPWTSCNQLTINTPFHIARRESHTSLFCSQRKSKDVTLVAGKNWGHNTSTAQVFSISPASPVLSSHNCSVPVSFFDWTRPALFISEPKHMPELWINLAAGSTDRELAVSFSEVHGSKHKENTWRYNQTANSNNGARSSHHSCFSDYKAALHSKWTRSKQPYNTA